MDWSNVNSQFLCNVFDYFSFKELKVLSLVCRNWCEEIAFLWQDKLQLDFKHFHNVPGSLQSNIQVLKESKRIYANLKICDYKCFEDTKAIFEAIPQRKERNNDSESEVSSKYVKSLELEGLSMSQIEDIFSWMGESLEELSVADIPDEKARKTIKTDAQYLKMFSKLQVVLVNDISEEFNRFFKYFENVTDLTLMCIHLLQFKEFLKCCPKVRKLHLRTIYSSKCIKSDFDILESLENLQEIYIDGPDYDKFLTLCVETFCDPEIKHIFPLKLLHIHQLVFGENIANLIYKFPNLENILVQRFDNKSESFKDIWNLKCLKSIRGTICYTKYLKDLNPFDLSPHFTMTTIDIWGTFNNIDCDLVIKVLKCLPKLENFTLSNFNGNICRVLEQLSMLSNLKSLTLKNVNERTSEYLEGNVPSLKTLQFLKIYNYRFEDHTTLESLNRSVDENNLLGKCLTSIITNSKNLEIIDVESIANLDIMNCYVSGILHLRKLKVLSLNFNCIKDMFQCVECFLRSTHNISFIDLKSKSKPTDKEEFEEQFKKLSKLADKSLILSDERDERDYLFFKNTTKIKFYVRKFSINLESFNQFI